VHREASLESVGCGSHTLASEASAIGGPCRQGLWALHLVLEANFEYDHGFEMTDNGCQQISVRRVCQVLEAARMSRSRPGAIRTVVELERSKAGNASGQACTRPTSVQQA